MKHIVSLVIFTSTILVGVVAAIFGIVGMVTQNTPFLEGFIYFSLGSLLAGVMCMFYLIGGIANNLKSLVEMMVKQAQEQMVEKMMGAQNGNSPHPLDLILRGLSGQGGPLSNGTIKIHKFDNNGHIFNLGEREFNSPEELIQFRDEILANAFGREVELKEMSLEELEKKETEAVKVQDFELAAAIRDLIKEKKTK